MDLTLAIILIGLLGGLSLFLAIRLSSLNSKSKTTAAENERVSNELAESRAENERVSNELAESRAENERISNELAALREENENLVANLNRLIESNENALWLLYLSQTALQMCITILHDEQQRLNNLQTSFDDFSDRVAEATQRRRIRRGVTALLGLIPGGNLIGILGDVLDVVADTVDVVDIAEDAADIEDLEDLEVDGGDPMMLTVSPASARNFLGLSTEQHELLDVEELTSDIFNTLLKNVIRRLMELTKSLSTDERRKIITHVAVNFGEFGIEYYRSEETGGASQSGNSSDSRKKE